MTFVHWRRFFFFTELRLKECGQESSASTAAVAATADSAPDPSMTAAINGRSIGLNDLSRLQQLDEDHLANSELQNENVAEQLSKIVITCSAAGRGSLVLGDESGFVHSVDRQLQIQSFHALAGSVTALQLLHKDPYLITAGKWRCKGMKKIGYIDKFNSLSLFLSAVVVRTKWLPISNQNLEH